MSSQQRQPNQNSSTATTVDPAPEQSDSALNADGDRSVIENLDADTPGTIRSFQATVKQFLFNNGPLTSQATVTVVNNAVGQRCTAVIKPVTSGDELTIIFTTPPGLQNPVTDEVTGEKSVVQAALNEFIDTAATELQAFQSETITGRIEHNN